ncbi:chitinase-3-like protein 1 [Dermacentor andersoni]|uniref:chitinase-3-like protein 1 n=1 Tax=Dermacentor andersoni TaxID=34620 RepID=UPI002155A043|nr:chitinase-3-like protein 1 [Dermacentor andersoni]
MAHANTMLYVTRVSFCIFVLFAMYLLGMLFYARTTAHPPAPVIVYQKAAPCPSAAPMKALADVPSSTPPAPSTSSTAKTTRASFDAPEAAETEEKQQHYHLFCFFNQSTQEDPSTTSLDVSQIPVGLCTHLVYSPVGINSRGFTLSLEGHDAGQGVIERFAAFGQPSKLLIAVGRSRHDWRAYQDIASDRHIARDFGLKLRRWLHDRNLDGAVINWPVPAKQRDATELVQEVKRALTDEQLLAVLLPHDQRRRRRMFDVRRLAAIADFLLFRMYGSHGPHRTEYPITEQDISLFPKAARSETGRDVFDKACMVLPLSGLSFVRASSSASLTPGAPARGLGPAGRHSRQAGSLAYHELCAANWTKVHAGHYGTAASRGSVWVGYHDATQLARIVHVARRRHGASCFALWALGDDDFRGSCGATKFPLVRAVAAECKAPIAT